MAVDVVNSNLVILLLVHCMLVLPLCLVVLCLVLIHVM